MPFEKGKSGNPAGAMPKELRLSEALNKRLREVKTYKEYEEAVSTVQHLANKLIKKAEDVEDPVVFKQLYETISDRTEGRAKQTQVLEGEDGKVANIITFTIEDKKSE